MLLIGTDGLHVDGATMCDSFGSLYDHICDFVVDKGFSVFHRKYDMIVNLPGAVISLMNRLF
jgi:hypothetical protein